MDYLPIAISPFSAFTEINQRIHWIYLWSSLLIAVIAYMFYRRAGVLETKSIFKFLFPRDIYFHRSAINDYLFFYSNFLFQATFILPLFITGTISISGYVNEVLASNFSEYQGFLNIDKKWKGLFTTLLLVLVADFVIFSAHYLQHKIPWLWEFHKVHHSAEVLVPITVFRMHPVDNILTFSVNTLVFGIFLGICGFLTSGELIYFNISGVNIFFIAFYLFGYNLRHTHIWISYGQIISHVFISPAQHQIHHSSAPEHFDKNMGFMFSFWDSLFNTLYIPKYREKIVFGLGKQENSRFSSFGSLYFMPFINLVNNFKSNMLWDPKRIFSILIFTVIVVPVILINKTNNTVQEIKKNIYLQDMTWNEVNYGLKNGVTTVLIPTGGTEQNGPHVILGKHNYIVKYAAGRIAEKLGQTLVAPVISYVPEGTISPVEGHMRFSGTLSVSNNEFRSILEAAARSLKQHGFKIIAFIGDSGGNQADQAFVAEKLSKLWRNEEVKVIQVNDYYQNNNQINYLMNHGYSSSQIGGHAGIRDTSELMAVLPGGVRESKRKSHIAANFDVVGADGDASKASSFLGKKLLSLKINAAVKQIKQQTYRRGSENKL